MKERRVSSLETKSANRNSKLGSSWIQRPSPEIWTQHSITMDLSEPCSLSKKVILSSSTYCSLGHFDYHAHDTELKWRASAGSSFEKRRLLVVCQICTSEGLSDWYYPWITFRSRRQRRLLSRESVKHVHFVHLGLWEFVFLKDFHHSESSGFHVLVRWNL